jgi:AcrR family transcriptional regulator
LAPTRERRRGALHPHSSETAALRRDEIIEAAIAIIARKGLPKLSLSEIEKKAGMSRGQLTYYFATKESILLAVFDRLLQLMYQGLGSPPGHTQGETAEAGGWDWVQHLLKALLTEPPVSPEFGCLQYTFLSQVGHRDDFRGRLVRLYEEWRDNLAQGLAADLDKRPPIRPVSPRALASLVQAILHGLRMQAVVDPQAFSGPEMMEFCLDVLGTYLWGDVQSPAKAPSRFRKKNSPSRAARRP